MPDSLGSAPPLHQNADAPSRGKAGIDKDGGAWYEPSHEAWRFDAMMQKQGTRVAETADVETASDAYAGRFAGAAGAWMLALQESVVLGWMADHPGATVLDVGGGHGQLAIPLAARGFPVTVLGSDESCRHRIDADVRRGRIHFVCGDLIGLPFPDASFDAVVSVRLLPHCGQWPALVRELCRTARRSVIVDYPTIQSINVFSSCLFGLKRRLEGNTRPYALFLHSDVREEFAKYGFRPSRRRAQYFFPMVLHRKLKRPRVSEALESVCRFTGLTALMGSPVLVEMTRREEEHG